MITPLFKYAGGKARMLESYTPFFAGLEEKTWFIDYFGGTGTMALWAKSLYPHVKIVLNEINPEIFGLYDALKNNYEEFMAYLRTLDTQYSHIMTEGLSRGLSRDLIAKPRDVEVGEKGKMKKIKGLLYETYYSISREAFYESLRVRYTNYPETFVSSAEQAATLYFMLQTNFSGIWQARVRDGVYNTPFGLGTEVNSRIDEQTLLGFHTMLQDAIILNKDFRDLGTDISRKDAIHYFDPPYTDSHTKYQKGGFSAEATQALCSLILSLHKDGETVFLSNKDGEELRNSLQPFLKFELFPIQYTAGRKNTEKGSRAVEILFHNNMNAAPTCGIDEEEYQAVICGLKSDYFLGKIVVNDESGCWYWVGCYQVKKTVRELRAHPIKPSPHNVLWCIVNKRLLPRGIQARRIKEKCSGTKCCNPYHREYPGEVERLKKLVNAPDFDLTVCEG